MRIVADENMPGDVVDALRREGHDVLWIKRDAPGSGDDMVLAIAQAEHRLLMTFDKDFGELAFSRKLPATRGIVLFRMTLPGPERTVQRVVAALRTRDDWQGHFSVIEDSRIRMTPLPNA